MTRKCTLHNNITITEGTLKDWLPFEQYHYRTGPLGVIDKIFLMKHKGQPAGIIIYGMPVPNIAIRNQVTQQRYTGLGRQLSLSLLNAELRTIKRVVIMPQYRAAGLATRLVRQTLPRAGTPLVEAIAAMGQVSSFFQHAQMTCYPQPQPQKSTRLLQAFNAVGIKKELIINQQKLIQAIKQLGSTHYQFIMKELQSFAQAYCHNERQRKTITFNNNTINQYTKITIEHLNTMGMYYLWQHNDNINTTI